MKFLIEKENLLNGLRIVEKITLQRGIQPVLSNFLLETDGNKIIFSSTDHVNAVKTNTVAMVEEEGKITLPAKRLLDIVSKMPDGKQISFSSIDEKTSMLIKCGNSKYEIVGINANEFPEIIKDEYLKSENSIKLEVAPIVNAIKKCAYCAVNESPTIFSDLYIIIENNILEAVVTDGNRLAKYKEELKSKDGKDISTVIPVKSLSEFMRIIQITEDDLIELIINEKNIIYKTEKFILYSKLKDGVNYPNYNQIIPQNCPKEAVINRNDLLSALERVMVLNESKLCNVKFNFSGNVLTLNSEVVSEGYGEEKIDIEYNDEEEMNISFSGRYVIDAVKAMEEEKIVLKMTSGNTASIFEPVDSKGYNYLCLIMPLGNR